MVIKCCNLSYKINFTDSARFVASSLSSLVDNLAEVIDKIEYKCLSCNKDYSNKIDKLILHQFYLNNLYCIINIYILLD